MTSGNAFRDAAHAPLAATSNGHSEHARKRRKLSPPPQANLYTRTGDASVALEVDHMILDYLSYGATKSVLASRMSEDIPSPSPQHKLTLVDSFLEMFKAKHPSFTPDPELRFRLLLLKFTTLYCHRLVQDAVVPSKAALRQLRETNTSRAMSWIQTADRMPSNDHDMSAFEAVEAHDCPSKNQSQSQSRHLHLSARRAQTLASLQFPIEDEAYQDAFYGTPESLALLDLLPLFMSVIAARNELNNSNLSSGLMDLAAQFMLQASLEQYLVRGASGCDAVDEAFAWGYKAVPLPNNEGHENGHNEVNSDGSKGEGAVDPTDEVDRMFQDEDEPLREVSDWSTVKSGFISQLARTNGDPFMRHLERVADKYPIDVFEQMVLQLLAGLAASLPNPILTQLEEGTLDGMSAEETEAFLGECGLKGHWPLPSGYKQ
jgi:hypothetical protein